MYTREDRNIVILLFVLIVIFFVLIVLCMKIYCFNSRREDQYCNIVCFNSRGQKYCFVLCMKIYVELYKFENNNKIILALSNHIGYEVQLKERSMH